MKGAAFGIDGVVTGIIEQGTSFVSSTSSGAGFAVFGIIMFFHLIEGAGELADKASCRFFTSRFWLRFGLVMALLVGYSTVFGGIVSRTVPKSMKNFADAWTLVWIEQSQHLEEIRKAESENQEIKYSEATATGSSIGLPDLGAAGAKIGRWAADAIITGLGFVLVGVLGFLITVFMLMEGFWALGIATLVTAVGPICVAAAAHEKTEAIFWGFVRSFVVYAILYMPMLALACQFAGVIMARMALMVGDSQLSYGDGTDIWVHGVIVLIGPLCALSIVRAVHSCVSGLFQGGGSGSGSGFAGVVGLMQTGAQAVASRVVPGAGAALGKVFGGGGSGGEGGSGGSGGGGGKSGSSNAAASAVRGG